MKTTSPRLAKPRVYIETSVISYLTARPSRDILILAHQQITAEWWREDRLAFEIFTSAVVETEAADGDPAAAKARLDALADIPQLEVTPQAVALAKKLIVALKLPQQAELDAYHIAVAAVHNIAFLLTWNCKHIANRHTLGITRAVCLAAGHEAPDLCTPETLLENPHEK